MQLPAEKNAGCSTGFECPISQWLTWRSVRTYGRTYERSHGSDVIIKPKFLVSMGLLNFLINGAPRARGAPLKIVVK